MAIAAVSIVGVLIALPDLLDDIPAGEDEMVKTIGHVLISDANAAIAPIINAWSSWRKEGFCAAASEFSRSVSANLPLGVFSLLIVFHLCFAILFLCLSLLRAVI